MNLCRRLNQVLQMCPKIGHKQNAVMGTQPSKIHLNKKLRRCINSQWFTSSTLTTPQRFLRPRTDLPSIIKFLADPTTANGMVFCARPSIKLISRKSSFSYPNHTIQLNFLVVIFISIKRIETNVLILQLFPNLIISCESEQRHAEPRLTLTLNFSRSSGVKLSDLAITGTTFTTSLSFFITITSIGRKAWPVGLMKYKQQWMRVSWM